MMYVGKSATGGEVYKVVRFKVEVQGDVVLVRRTSDGEIICDGRVGEGNRLYDIAFSHPDYQTNNRTRQAAMRAFQEAGYKSLQITIKSVDTSRWDVTGDQEKRNGKWVDFYYVVDGSGNKVDTQTFLKESEAHRHLYEVRQNVDKSVVSKTFYTMVYRRGGSLVGSVKRPRAASNLDHGTTRAAIQQLFPGKQVWSPMENYPRDVQLLETWTSQSPDGLTGRSGSHMEMWAVEKAMQDSIRIWVKDADLPQLRRETDALGVTMVAQAGEQRKGQTLIKLIGDHDDLTDLGSEWAFKSKAATGGLVYSAKALDSASEVDGFLGYCGARAPRPKNLTFAR